MLIQPDGGELSNELKESLTVVSVKAVMGSQYRISI